MESKGNVFGELMQQNKSLFKYPGVFEAAQEFLENNINKLYAHYNDLQLNKLDNFMLIYGTIFNMMRVFHDHIATNHKKNPIEAEDWTSMRKYYDMMLQYIEEILNLLWITNEYKSFERLVNDSIKRDKQQILGKVSSFKNFILKRDYEYQYKQTLSISQTIIKRLDAYIERGKIRTLLGTIVKAPVAKNGLKDSYIIRRMEILKLVDSLLSDFEKWKR
jgi:hypothetical protein